MKSYEQKFRDIYDQYQPIERYNYRVVAEKMAKVIQEADNEIADKDELTTLYSKLLLISIVGLIVLTFSVL